MLGAEIFLYFVQLSLVRKKNMYTILGSRTILIICILFGWQQKQKLLQYYITITNYIIYKLIIINKYIMKINYY